jgi:hypothetical protein
MMFKAADMMKTAKEIMDKGDKGEEMPEETPELGSLFAVGAEKHTKRRG